MKSICYLFFVASLSAVAEAEKNSALARVAIFEFNDNTGKANYGWVKTSLPDAINDSMQKHFEYVRADATAAEKSGKALMAGAKEYTTEAIAGLAKDFNLDIVIYGGYDYDAKSKLAKISAKVYHREGARIIGEVVETTPLNNDVFMKIEAISKKIVEHIYRYSLDLSAQDAERRRSEDIRLLVLVPTWKSESEKKAAIRELEIQKKELKKKYDAAFMTIFEFFAAKKTPAAEQKSVESFAKARNDAAIAAWLKEKKVSNAMIVFVSENKVNLRPVVDGVGKPPLSYALSATPAQKAASIEAAVSESGMKENLQRTVVMKNPGIWGRFSLAGGALYAAPLGQGSNAINANFGYELSALYRVFNFWVFQLGVVATISGITQKHTRYDGDADFNYSRYAGAAGPVFIFPMPFFRSLELQTGVTFGGVYSILEKYKYVDTTLNFRGANILATAFAEMRWHFWRGCFVGITGSYERIFYAGNDLSSIIAHLRVGYRF